MIVARSGLKRGWFCAMATRLASVPFVLWTRGVGVLYDGPANQNDRGPAAFLSSSVSLSLCPVCLVSLPPPCRRRRVVSLCLSLYLHGYSSSSYRGRRPEPGTRSPVRSRPPPGVDCI
ncbi:hypothetical protein GGS23DRAFT_77166 [Durotheca rogersii]|uniref:uncharacterized protein n=1 Tax=Durotheca rogersii TaxID=419775 RepID=UPI00221EAAA7|nr:uncharacterized protein GGS23DRAFT_77166 [Durotheca rogersii]KAI5862966.1 hypothetical protein GGS23DRAFT_77166 [Durotheca rogersii]